MSTYIFRAERIIDADTQELQQDQQPIKGEGRGDGAGHSSAPTGKADAAKDHGGHAVQRVRSPDGGIARSGRAGQRQAAQGSKRPGQAICQAACAVHAHATQEGGRAVAAQSVEGKAGPAAPEG